jgi:hypothetical protein
MIEQSQWRKAGMACLAISLGMAVYSISGDLLRHSIYRLLAPFNEDVTVPSNATSWWLIVPYWTIFAALIVFALYLAFLDIRYIRLQFALEKRKLFEETIRDPLVPSGKKSPETEETNSD